MPLMFSKSPGCNESHLRRRYRNALLSEDSVITQEEVNRAHQADLEELERFKESFTLLMNQAISLEATTESDVILKLKEDLDKLYEQCAGLTGDTRAYKKGLEKLTTIVMRAIRKGAGDDPVALSELKQEEIARTMHYELLEFPIVAHMLRPDSPIRPEELAAVLLGEDEAAVHAVLSLLEPEHITDLEKRAKILLHQHPGNISGAPFAHDIMTLIRQHAEHGACH